MSAPLSDFSPIVTALEPKNDTRPLIIITSHAILTDSGEFFVREDSSPRKKLRSLFRNSPPAIFVADHSLPILKELQDLFGKNPRFQFELLGVPHTTYNPEWEKLGRHAVHEKKIISRVGFLSKGKTRATETDRPATWHLLIDFTELSGAVCEGPQAMMEWARIFRQRVIREFDLKWRPTNSGIANQLLRSSRFYPEPRRKVPRMTNENIRRYGGLRGNHYDYRTDPHTTYQHVLEIDQQNAHHYAAANLTFPYSDSLFASWSYRNMESPAGGGLPHTSRHFERVLTGKHGALMVTLSVPHIRPDLFTPSFVTAEKPVLIFTNEVPYLRAMGVEPHTILAAWTAEAEPTGYGIRAYAEYCLELAHTISPGEWSTIKRTLLTLYGMLGARPKQFRRYYQQSQTHTETSEVYAGHGALKVVVAPPSNSEPFTANVIQRGMIESETMFRSLSLANELTLAGHTVLAVYADALYIRENETIPMLPAPWRVKNEMRTVTFPRLGAVVGRAADGSSVSKIPGGVRKAMRDNADYSHAISRV